MVSLKWYVAINIHIVISAFIEFEERRDAEDACKELNGIKLEGERISVEMSKVNIFIQVLQLKFQFTGLPR